MVSSLRSALLVIAAASASSVAPAKVGGDAEPLIAATSASLPKVVVPQAIPYPVLPDSADPVESEAETPEADAASPGSEPEIAKPTGDLSTLVAQLRGTDPGSRELECLAAGIYFEAKSEPLAGQLAVGEVIANRADSGGRFPSTYCGVLFQRGQFSFVRGGKWPAVNRSGRQWQNAVAIARIVDQDLKDSAADKALFFHARRVSPKWRLKRVAAIGNHIFYR
ncbi:MAG TPA: cell wall hydrolase [Sphingomicrobium sp.]|nr:cell wall hydrolase [Sphingomicrobium sp.]